MPCRTIGTLGSERFEKRCFCCSKAWCVRVGGFALMRKNRREQGNEMERCKLWHFPLCINPHLHAEFVPLFYFTPTPCCTFMSMME